MESWLVISNAQTHNLANSLRLLTNDIEIDAVTIWHLKADLNSYQPKIPDYDRVIIHPFIEQGYCDFSTAAKLDRIPSIAFDAYHPDVCFTLMGGGIFNGVMGAYHSMIGLAAFRAGLSVERACSLFRRDIFERCGFLNRWKGERQQLMDNFARYGLDISAPFRSWGRRESFMHGIDHSKARPIHDIAHTYLQSCGIEPNPTDIVPADLIMTGVCFPVYPEIAEALGVEGSYMFKRYQEYRLISLQDFMEQSFAAYSNYPIEEITIDPRFRQRFELVGSVIAEETGTETLDIDAA
ncbi:WcbI family polysaccharide biosynthesis putative acetyltransferase [Rhizobium rhizogenes]|uniref:WcbI family polysaccharide biosynthesis putative acetyltransferase n=1 Tax=Rhizobium rhizogenes TaxID=359 RepID=UPI0015744E2A|nr:WcbI family polysaccharide biosynthesis putative acetyltransferase [Rhizobium rhizogenes]NTF40767.1 hypothetical protein [Rhizobium rhizogenes]